MRFLIATNPGQEPGPLGAHRLGRRVVAAHAGAEGRAVSRLAGADAGVRRGGSGVGGATAAAVGERLARVAERVQVLVVTHSPQVAARGGAHLRVAKAAAAGAPRPRSTGSIAATRREEIARMLAGETITEAARAAADDCWVRRGMSRKPRRRRAADAQSTS